PSVFLNDTAPPLLLPLSLHDALPILISLDNFSAIAACSSSALRALIASCTASFALLISAPAAGRSSADNLPKPFIKSQCKMQSRSEEHTSELQSRENLVCRLLLEKKK